MKEGLRMAYHSLLNSCLWMNWGKVMDFGSHPPGEVSPLNIPKPRSHRLTLVKISESQSQTKSHESEKVT